MIIKEEYKKISLRNIKEECRNIFKNFKSSGSEIRKMEESFREMHMDEEPEWPLSQSIEEDIRYKLFKDISALKHSNRKSGQWICQELKCKLMELFEQYPFEHATIKKAMRISNSTYHR